jgi:hypothetical protein
VLSVLTNGGFTIPGAGGVTVEGDYGTLTVFSNGDYVYVPNAELANIGQVEQFTYKLTHPNGDEDTATLFVRVDTPNVPLPWNDDDLGEAVNYVVEPVAGVLTGTEDNDTLDGVTGGALTFNALGGDDIIAIYDTDFASADGGDGFDTLYWNGGDTSIVLSDIAGNVDDIEVVDLNTHSEVALTVTLQDLLDVTDPATDTLLVKGDAGDSVELAGSGSWSSAGPGDLDGVGYTVYTNSDDPTQELWIQNGVNVV